MQICRGLTDSKLAVAARLHHHLNNFLKPLSKHGTRQAIASSEHCKRKTRAKKWQNIESSYNSEQLLLIAPEGSKARVWM